MEYTQTNKCHQRLPGLHRNRHLCILSECSMWSTSNSTLLTHLAPPHLEPANRGHLDTFLAKNMFIHWIFRWHLACLDKKVDIGKFLMVFNTHRTGITVDWTPKKLTEIGKKLVIFSILCIYPSIYCWPLIAQGTGCLYKSWIYPCCH